MKYTVTSDSKLAAANLDTAKNVSYEPNPAIVDVDASTNVAYEPNAVGLSTKENVSYVVHTRSK